MSEGRARFLKTLDALEEQLDKGFFLSFINKIIVDEKRIYTIINELRSMATDQFSDDRRPDRADAGAGRGGFVFEPPAPARPEPVEAPRMSARDVSAAEKEAADIVESALKEAENIRAGADEYARQVLSDLEQKLGKALRVVGEGKKVLDDRLG